MTMDHKTIENREARADVMMMIAGIGDDKKKELLEKYKCERDPISKNRQRLLVGNWFNNAVTMLKKGATEEELNRVVEHIIVLMMAHSYPVDFYRSYKDNDLLNLSEKYVVHYRKVKNEEGEMILEKRKRLVEEKEKWRKETKEKIQNMKDSGCTNEYIAEELMIPESTVRNIMLSD